MTTVASLPSRAADGAGPGGLLTAWPTGWGHRYLVAQGLATLAWWFLLATWPAARAQFELAPHARSVLDAYLPGDLLVVGLGSFLAARSVRTRPRLAPLVAGGTAGGLTYATATLVPWLLRGGHGLIGVLIMTGATAITVGVALRWQVELP